MEEMKILSINNEEYEVVDGKARPVLSVSDMKGMPNLVAGNVIKTLGYYTPNDGGGASYLIRVRTENDIEDSGMLHFINDNLVAELIIKDNTINAKSFGLKSNENIDNTPYLQNAINKLNSELTLFIPDGLYQFNSTIDMTNLPDGVVIKCYGTLKYNGNETFINLNVNDGDIYIKKVISNYANYKILPSNDKLIAVNILSCVKSHITIDYISSFKKGFQIIGDGTTKDDGSYLYTYRGTIYCDFNCRYLDCYIGFYITKNYGYVNENTFNIGWINAYNGIQFADNDTWDDPFNSNKFYNTGLENIENTGFLLNGCRRNLIISPRFENTENKFIIEDETCSSNMFIFSYSCDQNCLELNGLRRVVLGNQSDQYGDVASQFEMTGYNNTKISLNRNYNSNAKNNTIFFEDNGFDGDIFCKVKKADGTTGEVRFFDKTSNGTIKVNSTSIEIDRKIKMVYAVSPNDEVTIKTNPDMQQAGHSFLVCVNYHTNPIKIQKATGTTVINDVGEVGTYMIMYINESWHKIKISDENYAM